jgi:hypothetical protein
MSIRIGIGLDNFASGGIDADATTIYNRIIADGGVSNLTRLNFFVKGLKAIYGSLTNVPVCYDAHWIGYKLGSGTGATAGQAAAKLYSLTVAGDAVQATAASQPLLLAHNGASSDNYWWVTTAGSSGTSLCSTPDASANQITGSIEFTAKFSTSTPTLGLFLIGKDTTSIRGYNFVYNNGILSIALRKGGSFAGYNSTASFSLAVNQIIYVKGNYNSITGNINFFTSNDGISYTQLGATVSAGAGAIDSVSTAVSVGAFGNGNGLTHNGVNIYRATISNSIGGAPVVDFNPATYNASTSQTNWTSATGEVWTINTGTATTGYKGVLVNRTITMGDGVDDKLLASSVSVAQPDTIYAVNRVFSKGTAVNWVCDGNDTTRHSIYDDQNSVQSIFAGTTHNIGNTSLLLKLTTALFNSASSSIAINNGTATVGNANTQSLVGLNLFSRFSTSFGNVNLQTLLISNANDVAGTRTATYNLIRSLNNNAF